MSRFYSYLNSGKEILTTYKGQEPFASFLKKFFAANKKYGSKDRKQISHLCYGYFRLGGMAARWPIEEAIVAGLFLGSEDSNLILATLNPAWNEKIGLPLAEKLAIVGVENAEEIFPFKNQLSDEIDVTKFAVSFLTQPDLFIRIRPGKEKIVNEKLAAAGIEYRTIKPNCIAIPNTTKLEDLLQLNSEAVIQDYNSQRVMDGLPEDINKNRPLLVWDCCAASGGKSILAYDRLPGRELTVSDIRQSIIRNLQKRFEQAGIKKYESFVGDVADKNFSIHQRFHLVICDAPCSGSGTWGRTPEHLHSFKKEEIERYATLQKAIALNAARAVHAGGYFLYITCSVFKQENDDVVNYLLASTSLKLVNFNYYKGYEQKADTLFAAVFQL